MSDTKRTEYKKAWHIQEPLKARKAEAEKPYILITENPITEVNEKGEIITKFEKIKTNPFEKVNETEKLLKQTQMQELLNKINELEEGI